MKKYCTIICLIFFSSLVFAQELTKEQYEALKTDNIEMFQQNFKPEDYTKCYQIKEGSYPLINIAIRKNLGNIFKFLLDKTNLNQNCDGRTPLMYATKYGQIEYVKILLEKGADKTLKNQQGETALDYAKKYNQTEIIKLLE